MTMERVSLPETFAERVRKQLGTKGYEHFLQALQNPSPVSIRYNPAKAQISAAEEFIPWDDQAVYLPERPSFILDPLWHAGAYYVQEASSMITAYLLKQFVNFDSDLQVLDLCAAPGGKSTQVVSLLSHGSKMICNELLPKRAIILKENMIRWGYPNVYVTQNDPADLRFLQNSFDIVLVDAPCSGEGLFRKDPLAVSEWSPNAVVACVTRQHKLLSEAAALVRPGGWLVYSTCTFNDRENINNTQLLIDQYGFECMSPEVPDSFGFERIKKGSAIGFQAWPHKVKGEGFFISILQKNMEAKSEVPKVFNSRKPQRDRLLSMASAKETEALSAFIGGTQAYEKVSFKGNIHLLPAGQKTWLEHITQGLRVLSAGIEAGEVKGQHWIPAHALALSTLSNSFSEKWDLDNEHALNYLRRNTLHASETCASGWTLITYQNKGIGWAKVLENRVNNYLPNEWRIIRA